MNWVYVILGAAIGAPMRYLTDRAIQRRHSTPFPFGTLTVNIVASLMLGLITGMTAAGAASEHMQLLVGTGVCATLSTYSTFSFETVRLIQDDAHRWAAANVVVSVGLGLGAAAVGVALGGLA